MSPTPLRTATSLLAGWLADRRVPAVLRRPLYRTWARATRCDLDEVLLPLDAFPSLGAFFVRHLRAGARPFTPDPDLLPSPVDGTVQSIDTIEAGSILQAKGRPYGVDALLARPGAAASFEGGTAITIYLAPHDYHRIHAPIDARLDEVTWLPGARFSVHPRVLAARERVLSINERVVLRMESEARGPFELVLVGALNVGRIRVVGVDPRRPAPTPALGFARGDELARFEMGSTVVLLWPRGVLAAVTDGVARGTAVRLGSPIARFA